MNSIMYTKIVSLLVAVAVLSAVAPVAVSAEDTIRITNTSYSSVSTGGHSSKGTDGEDGQDGEDGKDGADGADGRDGEDGQAGVSIINTIGADTSSTHIQSSVNGETVVDIHETVSDSAAVESESEVAVIATGTSAVATATAETVSAGEPDESQSISTIARIKNAFESLQVIILSYVSFIF